MSKRKYSLTLFSAIDHVNRSEKVIIGYLNILVIGLSGLMVLSCTAHEESLENGAVDLKELVLEEDLRISIDHPKVLAGSFSGIAVDDKNIRIYRKVCG